MSYLKEKMKEKKIETTMTETELAKRTGMSRQTICEYVTGKKKIKKVEHLMNIVQALDIPLEEFIKNI